ncbi:MAG: tRNA uridine-5-carboxymethylaminomethyl(34) synthesis GTPase MnmE [Gemmatimonas sp.]|uniref:tRNA uridine-5-carboxymethylaminomethyl(34) synthesis GTPase MnmE n=1 Tax=Gemmatimonas sp. TaxID=1962908 RepID=UPI00391F11A2
MSGLAALPGGDDTIVATATAPGRGAVAVIRLSGARAKENARALGAFGGLGGATPIPRRTSMVALVHPDSGEPLDAVLVTWFAAPRSYTGEDVVEIATHGGLVSPARVLAACQAAGARLALPGEFTRRAVGNGRLDLLQAEAVADLIDARTSAMHRQALAQLDGGLSRRLQALREEVIHLEALLAYDIDFPEEDDGPIAPARIADAAAALREALVALLRTAPRGAMVRDGVLVVIAGPPNAGKSSLFNALLGDARAIVTPIPGTTRDAIEALLDRQPVPLRLVDTAGLRDTDDEVERLGIEVSARYLSQAQVVLACGATAAEVAHTLDVVRPRTPGVVVPVRTKQDLATSAHGADAEGAATAVPVSAERGDGLDALLAAIDAAVSETAPLRPDEPVVVTRERHRAGLSGALEEIDAFAQAWATGALPPPVAAVHLLAAREAIAELIGVVDTEDVLDRVFRDFCIGK